MRRGTPKSAKDARKRDPDNAEHWPVHEYPYMVVKNPSAPKLFRDKKYFTSWKKATAWIVADVKKLRDQFSSSGLDADTIRSCERIMEKVRKISLDGGSLDEVADPYTGTRYRAELIRRRAAT